MPASTVGNDVVHLSDPVIAEHHRRSRFVERVCGQDEAQRVAQSDDPHRALWTLFAAKEAAFKAVVKLRPGIPFAHRRFLVAPSLAEIVYDDLTLALRVDQQPDWTHAVVTTSKARAVFAVSKNVEAVDQSIACRTLLCRVVASRSRLPFDALSIRRGETPGSWDGYAPPELCLEDRVLPIDISLSHDGPFVACAALPTWSSAELDDDVLDDRGHTAPIGWAR